MKVLMSIKPKFVEQMFSRTKTFELRKKIFKSSINTIVIYGTSTKKGVIRWKKFVSGVLIIIMGNVLF